jgi:hypothetical protein
VGRGSGLFRARFTAWSRVWQLVGRFNSREERILTILRRALILMAITSTVACIWTTVTGQTLLKGSADALRVTSLEGQRIILEHVSAAL